MSLEIENYTDSHIIVRGDKDSYGQILKGLKGRWYKNIKGKEGWSVPIEYKNNVQSLTTLTLIKDTCKDKNTQKKYKSSHSDDEDCEDDSDFDDVKDIENFYEQYQKSPTSQDIESEDEVADDEQDEII